MLTDEISIHGDEDEMEAPKDDSSDAPDGATAVVVETIGKATGGKEESDAGVENNKEESEVDDEDSKDSKKESGKVADDEDEMEAPKDDSSDAPDGANAVVETDVDDEDSKTDNKKIIEQDEGRKGSKDDSSNISVGATTVVVSGNSKIIGIQSGKSIGDKKEINAAMENDCEKPIEDDEGSRDSEDDSSDISVGATAELKAKMAKTKKKRTKIDEVSSGNNSTLSSKRSEDDSSDISVGAIAELKAKMAKTKKKRTKIDEVSSGNNSTPVSYTHLTLPTIA